MANSDAEPVKHKFLLVEGVNFPNTPLVRPDPNFPEDLKRFKPRKDDVFVCSYPKSGTNWLCEILWQIYHNGATSNVNIGERVYWFDVHPLLRMPENNGPDSPSKPKPVIDLLPSPRLMRTHLPYHVIPKGQDETLRCKYIYIARNAKDVAVSYHQFYEAMALMREWKISLDTMVQKILLGMVPFNKWSDHVLGWWKHKDDENVLFLKYEDMKKDLSSAVRTIAEFLQKPLVEEVIQRIVHQCSFEEMAKRSDTYLVFPGVDDATFLRKGIAGDWKNHLSSEMSKRLEEEFLAEAKQHGLEFE